jgi:hypothetical protein
VEWFDYTEEERIKNIFTKFTIKDFWEWWSEGGRVMEVRIRDFQLIKQIAEELNAPYSASGVYINSDFLLKQTIARIRRLNVTAWFGINSRKPNYNKYGNKSFGGSDNNVESIDYIFVDIDRINKISKATNEELKKCDGLANKILERFAKANWDKNYIKICSGNGVQLLIKLDVPLRMPSLTFNNDKKYFESSIEFDNMKALLRNSIGKDMLKFSKKFTLDFNADVDKSCFGIGKVGALPFTKNFKYDGFTWRGIIDLKSGSNIGLTDYLLNSMKDVKEYKKKSVFVTTKAKAPKHIIGEEGAENHPLIRFGLDNSFPHGEINNTLWCQMLCLMRDNKIPKETMKKIAKDMSVKHRDNFDDKYPKANITFKEKTVNNFCLRNGYPPFFDYSKIFTKRRDVDIDNIDWSMRFLVGGQKIEIEGGEDIERDMQHAKRLLVEGRKDNNEMVYKFTNACIEKYGEEKTRFYFDNYFKWYLGYDY